MKTTAAKTIKDLFIAMERIEIIADAAEEAYEKKPKDIERENAFDLACKAQFEVTEKLVSELCKLGYNAKTWRKVLATKRDFIRDLCNRLAA